LEERGKALKEYLEKAKFQISQLEINSAELKGNLKEAQEKMQKYRKSFQDSGSLCFFSFYLFSYFFFRFRDIIAIESADCERE
jgi:hypothetical protein